MQYEVLEDKKLRIFCTLDEQEELAEDLVDHSPNDVWGEIVSDLDGLETIDPDTVSALTAAPIVGEGVSYDDQGNLDGLEVAWWYPNYQIRSPVDDLLEKGETILDWAALSEEGHTVDDPGLIEITEQHFKDLEGIREGADILSPAIAKRLVEVKFMVPEALIITEPLTSRENEAIFGAMLKAKGKELLERRVNLPERVKA